MRMVFQMAPDTEAPAEMLFYLPRLQGAVRGRGRHPHPAQPADPARCGGPRPARAGRTTSPRPSTCSAAGPTWCSPRITGRPGATSVVDFLALQRDLYAYLHDQTLRMLNQGLTGPEIAEAIALPPALENAWHTRGYYGSVSHNVKAIYQRYMGWFDGNPAHLWQHPPVEAGHAVRRARWAARTPSWTRPATASTTATSAGPPKSLNHVVFAEPDHAAARELLADTYEQLGYGARERHLAQLLPLRRDRAARRPVRHPDRDRLRRRGLQPQPRRCSSTPSRSRSTGPGAWDEKLGIDIVLTDADERYRLRLSNGALTYSSAPQTRRRRRHPDAAPSIPPHPRPWNHRPRRADRGRNQGHRRRTGPRPTVRAAPARRPRLRHRYPRMNHVTEGPGSPPGH